MKVAEKNKSTSEYKEASIEDTLETLNTSMQGLTNSEVRDRIQRYGYNEVIEKKKNPFLQFFRRYWGPMPWLLEVAIILAYFLGHYLESGIILVLLTMNAIIGYIQERGSQKALESLKKRLAIKAKVLRDGQWIVIEAREIVPGDIIALGLGDVIPADAKIADGELSIDQSVLTGESLPVDARQSSLVYSSSIVKRGEGQGCCDQHRHEYLFRQNRRTGENRPSEITSRRDYAGHCPVYAVFRISRLSPGSDIFGIDWYRGLIHSHLCRNFSHGRRSGGLAGSNDYRAIGRRD